MEKVLPHLGYLVKFLSAWFANSNFGDLDPYQKAEAVKHMAGFAAGVAAMPQGAGMGFLEGKLAGAAGNLPTSPQSMASGLVNWIIDQGTNAAAALGGDEAAADQAVQGVHKIGNYMAGWQGNE